MITISFTVKAGYGETQPLLKLAQSQIVSYHQRKHRGFASGCAALHLWKESWVCLILTRGLKVSSVCGETGSRKPHWPTAMLSSKQTTKYKRSGRTRSSKQEAPACQCFSPRLQLSVLEEVQGDRGREREKKRRFICRRSKMICMRWVTPITNGW